MFTTISWIVGIFLVVYGVYGMITMLLYAKVYEKLIGNVLVAESGWQILTDRDLIYGVAIFRYGILLLVGLILI